MITIRRATPQDESQLTLLAIELCHYEQNISPIKVMNDKARDFLENGFARWLKEPDKYHIFVAEQNGPCVGYVFGWIENVTETYRNANVGYICDCFVLPQFRSQGIADKLLTTIEQQFSSMNIKEVTLKVLENNPSANYWRHRGFQTGYLEMRKIL